VFTLDRPRNATQWDQGNGQPVGSTCCAIFINWGHYSQSMGPTT